MTFKSISACAIQLGSHTIETWSVNQQVVSLWVMVYAWIYCKHVLTEILHTTKLDEDIKMRICTGSHAARGVIHRVECGRVRHL